MVPIMSKFPKFLKIKERKTYIYISNYPRDFNDKRQTKNIPATPVEATRDVTLTVPPTLLEHRNGKSFGSGEGTRSKTHAG
jgi:hypothetical protein